MLVVVSIIVLLISLLLPALGRAREDARRTVCASNLHAYGEGFVSYSLENQRDVMKIVEEWGGRPYPNYIRRDSTAQSRFNGEWAINLIKAHADGIDDKNIYGLAICPSIEAALMQKFIRETNVPNHSFFEFQYTYWGRVNRLQESDYMGNVQEDLTRRKLSGDRIIMSDILYWDQSDRAWRYNHGPNGWAFQERSYMPWDRGDSPNITGTNQTFGDGHVEWKPEKEFPYLNLMSNPSGYPGGALGRRGANGDTFYY